MPHLKPQPYQRIIILDDKLKRVKIVQYFSLLNHIKHDSQSISNFCDSHGIFLKCFVTSKIMYCGNKQQVSAIKVPQIT